jgi:hypothetical protein
MDARGQTVRFRDCTCPGSPHDGRDGADDGDIVTLRPHLGFAAGAEALRKIIEADGDVNRVAELVGPVYIREGVIGWNVIAEDGGAAELDIAAILDDYALAYPIAEAADDLYSEVVLRPLVVRMNALSGNGRTAASTRPTRRSSKPRRSPPASSSQNGTAGTLSAVIP